MKKIFFLLLIALAAATGTKAQEIKTPDPNAPEITFEKEVIDYGTIEYNANGVREFKFKNTGKSALILQDVHSSCGCLVPTWPREPIKPGESDIIKVQYDTHRVGSFEKTITVISNANTQTKVLRVKGVVKPNANPTPPSDK